MKLLGRIPEPKVESIQWEPPGKVTVTMAGIYVGIDPPTDPPKCPVPRVIPVGYETEDSLEGGFGKIKWRFEGDGPLGGGGGGDNDASPNEVIELSVGVDQIPLGMHPHIDKILSTFGGSVKDGEISFPEKDPTGSSQRKGVAADGSSFSLNPMYGVTSFFAPRATARWRRMNVDPNIDNLGKLDDPPFLSSVKTGLSKSATNWIKTSVTRRRHGLASEVTEEWLYSLTGWEPMIYDYT